MTIVRLLEAPIKIKSKGVLVGIRATHSAPVYAVKVGVEVVRRLDLCSIFRWRILEVLDGGLPVEVRTDRVQESH